MQRNMFTHSINKQIQSPFLQDVSEKILRSRLFPFSQKSLLKQFSKLHKLFKNHTSLIRSLNIQVNLIIPKKLENIKIEQWKFICTPTPNDTTIVMLTSSDSSQQQNLNLDELTKSLQNINPCALYSIYKNSKTQFLFTFDQSQLSAFGGENTFEIVLDQFEFKDYNCSIKLKYNYEIEDQEEEFQIIEPEVKKRVQLKLAFTGQSNNESNNRKYSEGVPALASFPTKTNIIQQNKIMQLKKMFNQIDFSKISTFTIQNAILKYT